MTIQQQCIHGVELQDPCWECEERTKLRPVVEGPPTQGPAWMPRFLVPEERLR
jgi:hypothetical protein